VVDFENKWSPTWDKWLLESETYPQFEVVSNS